MPDLKPSVLRSQLAKLRKRAPDAGLFALRCRRPWTGGARIEVDGVGFRVLQTSCELAMRSAACEAEAAGEPLVLLTELNESSIGDDLLARFARARIERLHDWQMVHDAFGTHAVDSRLNRYAWLIELLAQNMPEDGYPPAPNGTLTLDVATGAFLRCHLQFDTERPDARQVLVWSRRKTGVREYLALGADQRVDVQQWVEASAGPLGDYLMRVVATGESADLVVCGLCCEVLSAQPADGTSSVLREAAVRLERFTGHLPVPRALESAWAREAAAALHDIEAEGAADARNVLPSQLERMLTDLGVAGCTWLSSIAPGGFEQRLARLGRRLSAGLRGGSLPALDDLARLVDHAAGHRQASVTPERVERARMARRLCGWLTARPQVSAQGAPTTLPALAAQYAEDVGLADQAREALLPGDACPELSAAYRTLLDRVGEARETFNQAFGNALAAHVSTDASAPDCLNIEDVLRCVVVPLASETPVLMLIIDGMGMAVFHSLLSDLTRQQGWCELGPETGTWPLPVIAALPTVTQVSRSALLGGRLPPSPSLRESDALAANDDVRNVCAGHVPLLFAKRDLLAAGGLELAQELNAALHDPRRRLVAAIINAVDDQLPHGDQVAIAWRIQAIPVLEKLLHAAAMTGRTVVMVSDHGHVRDVETALIAGEDAQRFRPVGEPPQDGEVLLRGRRVCHGNGAIVAPWTEKLRYGRKQHGYHGGVTPQEVVVPLAVLYHGTPKVKGWATRSRPQPDWWLDAPVKPLKAKMPPADADLEPLFASAAGAEAGKDWVAALWRSPIMAQQLALAPRAAPAQERAKPILEALAEHGGSLLLPALARHADQPGRLRGLIAVLKQILNVDGYPVLLHDAVSDTVTLDMHLLRRQFELEP